MTQERFSAHIVPHVTVHPDIRMKTTTSRYLDRHIDEIVRVKGAIHRIRHMGGIVFVVLRDRDGFTQCIAEPSELVSDATSLTEGSWVTITGQVVADPRAPHGVEVRLVEVNVETKIDIDMPVVINRKVVDAAIDTVLNFRPITLRHPRMRAIFKIQEAIAIAFREFLQREHFTEIYTPKVVSEGAEGGANVFDLEYFGRSAYLAQSPQFYKQIMVGVFERVYEIGPVYRAEKHNTSRHLNEYISLDLEMGFIDSFIDVMEMETALLQYVFTYVREHRREELELLEATVPSFTEIPALRLDEAHQLVRDVFGKEVVPEGDLDPESEELVCRYAREMWGSELVFVTHYPSAKRPFYAMDDPADPRFTCSFDLLFRGLEVTTGGQRIHEYDVQVAKLERRGLSPIAFESYLQMHKYGVPPHGGLAIGLERLAMKLLGLRNVREASLFPRDIDRITP